MKRGDGGYGIPNTGYEDYRLSNKREKQNYIDNKSPRWIISQKTSKALKKRFINGFANKESAMVDCESYCPRIENGSLFTSDN